jgi:hypothetical protein
MQRNGTKSLVLTLAVTVSLAASHTARAQDNTYRRPPTRAATQPAAQMQASTTTAAPATQGYQPAPPPPAVGYPMYPEYKGRYGGALSGGADVINAQANYLVSFQEQYLEREKVKSARIDNKRKAQEQFLWERENMPTHQDDRERTQGQELRRTRTQPPPTEIWSGKSLNDLLAAIQQAEQQAGLRGPVVPLDDELLRHINFTTGTSQGSPSMLREGRLAWTPTLRRSTFDTDRKQADRLVADLTRQSGGADGALDSLVECTDRLRSQLKKQVAEVQPNDYIQAVRYLNQLQETLRAAQRQGGAGSLASKSSVQAGSVGELIAQMGRQGLRFGPAATGDEGAYNAMHQALLAYDSGLSRMTASR